MRKLFLLIGAALLAPGCEARQESAQTPAEAEQARLHAQRDQARREAGEIHFIVDKSDRELRVYRAGPDGRGDAGADGDADVGAPFLRRPVSVGTARYETPAGRWMLDRVDINPEWNPPDSPWARGERQRPPGDPENPMGQARLVFNMPYTIHGTDDLDSLGKAESHGSIRIANPDAVALAELLLRAGGAWDGRPLFDDMVAARTTEFQIDLPHPVAIEVRE